MFRPKTHIARESSVPEIRERLRRERGSGYLSLSSVGETLPVMEYWPAAIRPGVTLSADDPPGSCIWPKHKPEWEQLYDAVLAAPFDFAPRGVLADCLDDLGIDPDLSFQLRGFDPTGRRYGFSRCYRTRWTGGPGWIVKGPSGTWDVWHGASGQFMQACRGGLFLDCPIVAAILYDREPWAGMLYQGYYWHLEGSGSPAEAAQSVINDVIACFLAEAVCKPVEGRIGLYRSSNHISAMVALSYACVNLGRYAIGLPVLPAEMDGYAQACIRIYSDRYYPDESTPLLPPGPTACYGRNEIRRALP
jgi:hypothetical protein